MASVAFSRPTLCACCAALAITSAVWSNVAAGDPGLEERLTKKHPSVSRMTPVAAAVGPWDTFVAVHLTD